MRDPAPLTQTPVHKSGADLARSLSVALLSALVPAISPLLMPTPSVLDDFPRAGDSCDSPSHVTRA